MLASDKDQLDENMRAAMLFRQFVTTIDGLKLTVQDRQLEYKPKVAAAMIAWERLVSLALSLPTVNTSKLEDIISATMRLILHDEWKTLPSVMKRKFDQLLTNFMHLPNINQYDASNFKALIKMLHDPWGNPAWQSILCDMESPDVEEKLTVTTSLELMIRLEVLMNKPDGGKTALEFASLAIQSLMKLNSNLSKHCVSLHKVQIIYWYTHLLYKIQQHDVFEKGLPLQLPIQDSKVAFVAKLYATLFAWERYIESLSSWESSDNSKLHSIIRGTMKVVLDEGWQTVPASMKTQLSQHLECILEKVDSKHEAANLSALKRMLPNPWGHSSWQSIIHNVPMPEEDQEVLEVGTSLELVLRLEILMKSHNQEDAALSLASLAMHSVVTEESNLSQKCSAEHKNLIIDWYIQLLYKKQQKCIFEKVLKYILFSDGVRLVRRFSTTKNAELKDCKHDIALICATSLLEHSINKPSLDIKKVAELASEWAYLHERRGTDSKLVTMKTEELLKEAHCSQYVYALCNILHEHRQVYKELCSKFVEEVISCLGLDFNNMERQKGQVTTTSSSTIALSFGLSQLAKLFRDDNIMSRELLLSSFSLNPTKEMYYKLVRIAEESGFKKPDKKEYLEKNQKRDCKKEPSPKKKKISLTKLSVKALQDLSKLVSKARLGKLSWSMSWHELSTLCQRCYLHPETLHSQKSTPKKHKSSSSKTSNTTPKTCAKSLVLNKVEAESMKEGFSKSAGSSTAHAELQCLVESTCKKLISSDKLERKNMPALELPNNHALPIEHISGNCNQSAVEEIEGKIQTFLNTKTVTDPSPIEKNKQGLHDVKVLPIATENVDVLQSVNMSVTLFPDFERPLVMQLGEKIINQV